MPVFCDECGKSLNSNDYSIYHESGDSCGAYCPEHHPLRMRDDEIQEVVTEMQKLGTESADLDDLVRDYKANSARAPSCGQLYAAAKDVGLSDQVEQKQHACKHG